MKHTLILAGFFFVTFLIVIKFRNVDAASQQRIESRTHGDHISYLPTDLSLMLDWYFEGGQDGAEMGFSVGTAGDVNGDGYDDIIIGSPHFDSTDNGGAAFVFYGTEGSLNTTPGWQVSSGMDGAQFGYSVSTAGDVNDDGYDDVIVGAPYYKVVFPDVTGEPKSGAAFLYLGSADGLSETPSWVQLAEKRDIAYGFSVATAGDVNWDGFADVIVGAPYFGSEAQQSSEGKTYLYLGSETGLAQNPAWSYECDLSSSKCGYAVSSAGDVNNDSYSDIIIGAPNYDRFWLDEGAALLFLGSSQGLSNTPDRTFSGGQENGAFGTSVATAGDVNGDTYDDVIVGAPTYDQDATHLNWGAAFIYLGSPSGPDSNFDWITYGASEYSWYGISVGSAGDINQDGFSDLLIGAYKYGQNGGLDQPDEGAAFLYLGGYAGPQSTYRWSAFGNKADAWFGYSLGTAGDINGDGKADVIVGAPNYRFDEKTVMGRAFVFLNASSTSETTSHTIFLPAVTKPE